MYNKILFKDFEHEGWEKAAGNYENTWSSLKKKFVPSLLNSVNIKPGDRLLDLACGPGYVSDAAKNLGVYPVGIDFSATMIQLAKGRNLDLEFYEGDAEELNIEPGSFDAVTINFGVPHFSAPEKVFSEVRRVLKKSGKFAFTTWAKREENPGAKIMEDAINKYADLNIELPEGPPYFLFSDPDESRKVLSQAGFDKHSFLFSSVTIDWKVSSPSFLFDSELRGGVRTAAILSLQTQSVLEAIKSFVEKKVEKLKSGDGYLIPMTAHIISVAV